VTSSTDFYPIGYRLPPTETEDFQNCRINIADATKLETFVASAV